jgi:hypothetical protein
MKKKMGSGASVFVLLLFAPPELLYGQKEPVYYINEVYFDITGRTKEYALLLCSGIKKGDEVTGEAALLEYIAEKQQTLVNRRELQEAVIEFVPGEAEDDGRIPVDITIHAADTRNFIIVPEPRYSSSSGWSPKLRVRDFNFLGLLSPLKVDLTYRYHDGKDVTYSRSNLNLVFGIETPFRAAGYDWKFTTENMFSYYFGEPFSYGNINGVHLDIPFKNTALTFGFEQGINFGREYDDWKKYVYGVNFHDVWYGGSGVYGEWKIPLPFKTESLGALVYSPAVSGNVNYPFRDEDLAERGGFLFNASQRAGFDKVDWYGNFRRGADIYIENTNEYSFFYEGWNHSLSVNVTKHLVINDFFGISMRGRFTKWSYDSASKNDGTRWNAGGMVRGLEDYALSPDSMLLFNFDFIFHIVNVMFSKHFNDPKAGIINFELQAGAVVDIAMVDGIEVDNKRRFIRDITYRPRDWIVSGGVELFFFPLAFRSIYLCGSAVWNFRPLFNAGIMPGDDDMEIYIGFGHHY